MRRLDSVVISLILAVIGIVPLYCVATASAQTEAHPWDVNGDGSVDFIDLRLVGSQLGKRAATAAGPCGGRSPWFLNGLSYLLEQGKTIS